MTPLTALALLVVRAATLTPATVPATGYQEALLSLDAPATLHLSARSASGTSCELVDRVRGPFAQSGTAGAANCELDLLLDAGEYKVRLESARRGKGNVSLTATPFSELNASPLALTDGVGFVTTLKPRQQASYWLNVTDKKATPVIRVNGRHSGDVRLWRNGQWLEPISLFHTETSPVPGRPMHEWWLDQPLEAGEYKLVVYGLNSTTVTDSSIDDSLTLEAGLRDGPPERSVVFTLPPSGAFIVRIPKSAPTLAGLLSLDSAPETPVELQLYGDSYRRPTSTCRINKRALVPTCSTTVAGSGPRVLMVRGAPGTRGTVEWTNYSSTASRCDSGGYYGPTTTTFPFHGPKGPALVGVFDVPNDIDAVPLGCQLERVDKDGNVLETVGRSALRIGDGEMLDREFNYNGEGAVLWFEIAPHGNLARRVGLWSHRFRITTTGERKSTCEVYQFADKGELRRLTQSKPAGGECNELLSLSPGYYQLQLAGGLSGVEKLTIRIEGDTQAKPIAARGGCLFPNVNLTDDGYRLTLNRIGSAVEVRGLTVRRLPLGNSEPLHLQLDARQVIDLPLRTAGATFIRSAGGIAFGCKAESRTAAAEQGVCEVSAGEGTLTLSNPSDVAVDLTLSLPGGLSPLSPAHAYQPALKPLPRIEPEVPRWFDFDNHDSHAVLFDVETSGLYNVTTAGLLSTSCRLRTPVIDQVARNEGGGRGRNCLIQTYLQKGRYLFTAETVGSSKGRGALVLSRRPVKELAQVTGEGEQYFRVDANDLVRHKLVVTAPGQYQVATTVQGVPSLLCRLDDPEGWPVEPVPSRCNASRELRGGTYLWAQLPLTVESMRHTKLAKRRDEVVLTGTQPHPLDFFTWYRAELGPDGRDEFLFTLEGESSVEVVLTNGMQGRVYLLENDKPPKPVEVIPPVQPGEGSPRSESTPSLEVREEPSQPEEEHEYYGEGEEEGEGDYETLPPPARPAEVFQGSTAPPPPSGVRVLLPAGHYRIVAEHSHGDVGIDYRVHLGSAVLLPGMARDVPIPSTVPVQIPRDGTLRLRTDGEPDVRCRLFDATGRLVAEASGNGADWNCAIAEPVTKGRYTLVLESETQQPGETRVLLTLPPTEDRGLARNGMKLTLSAPVVSLAVPPGSADSVEELTFRTSAKTPLSCALEDESGAVVHRKLRVTDCTLLVRLRHEKFRVRLWTPDGTAQVATTLRSRPRVEGKKGEVPAEWAIAVSVPRPGRYRTSPHVFCIPEGRSGLLRPCGPETSLEAGVTLFSVAGTKPQPLSLDENVFAASDAPVPLSLSHRPFLQTVSASKRSLFFLEARVPHGERAAPSCGFDGAGSVRVRGDTFCFAVSRVGTETTSRLWAQGPGLLAARITRRALALPDRTEALHPGRQRLFFAQVGYFSLPKDSRSRLELTLPKDSWAVLLDDGGQALDLCAPHDDLSRCLLTGQAGSLVVASAEGRAELTLARLEGTPSLVAFNGLFEDEPISAGTVRLEVPSSDFERVATVEGALRCTVALDNGTRLASCQGRLPRKQGAELVIDHGTGPLRAMVHAPGQEKWARLGMKPPPHSGPALAPAVAVFLPAGPMDRTLVVEQEAAVRVASESGVCALFRGSDLVSVDGFEAGCELVRVLSPGPYRLLVRPFGKRAQQGTLRWTAEPVVQLGEGVGPEDWLAPGDVRLFRFDTVNQGKTGLGIQAKSERLQCAVFNDAHEPVKEGCQQYLSLEKGRYLLTVRNPPVPGATTLAFRPVLLGLSGEKNEIPEEYLKDFFRRVGVSP